MLYEIDTIDSETLQRLIELPGRFLLRTAVNFGHEKCFLAISVAECFPHADLAGPFVVVPAVIEKIDTPINCRADDLNGEPLIHMLETQMPAPDSDSGNFLAGASELSINHTFSLRLVDLAGIFGAVCDRSCPKKCATASCIAAERRHNGSPTRKRGVSL